MSRRIFAGAAFVAIACVSLARPAAADGEILLTHANTLAGNVTPDDTTRPTIPSLSQFPFEVASNLFVAAGKTGIRVASHNVTIDLNGFALQGTNVAFQASQGLPAGLPLKPGPASSRINASLREARQRSVMPGLSIPPGRRRAGSLLRSHRRRG